MSKGPLVRISPPDTKWIFSHLFDVKLSCSLKRQKRSKNEAGDGPFLTLIARGKLQQICYGRKRFYDFATRLGTERCGLKVTHPRHTRRGRHRSTSCASWPSQTWSGTTGSRSWETWSGPTHTSRRSSTPASSRPAGGLAAATPPSPQPRAVSRSRGLRGRQSPIQPHHYRSR